MAIKLTSVTVFPALLPPPVQKRTTTKYITRVQPMIVSHLDDFATFSSSLGTDLPMRQHSQVPFQSYLQDRQRVFEALFPDKKRSERLNDREWRIYMLPLDFLFLSVNPVVDMQIAVQPPNSGLPVAVSKNVDRVLTLEATKWDLRGLDYVLKPSDFELSVNGILFSEQKGMMSRLRGHLQMSVKFAIPSSLAMIPQEAIKTVGEAVRALVNMLYVHAQELLGICPMLLVFSSGNVNSTLSASIGVGVLGVVGRTTVSSSGPGDRELLTAHS